MNVDGLSSEDLEFITMAMFPALPKAMISDIVTFNNKVLSFANCSKYIMQGINLKVFRSTKTLSLEVRGEQVVDLGK